MLKQNLILGARSEKEQQTKVKLTKLGGDTSLRNGMVAIAYNVSVLYDVADFQQKAQYEAPKFELVQMFNRSTSVAILYSTC
jgi:hypothetical protein